MKLLKLTFNFKSLILNLVLFVFVLVKPAYAEVKASTIQQSYYVGDIITLKIESNKSQKSEPDLNALNKDFEIKGTSVNSQVSIMNGVRSYKKIWNIELQAKSKGQLTIPRINVGSESSNTLTISVKELPPEVAAETKKHIFIEAKADIKNAEIYVQQQIPYTVKFYYDVAMQTGEVVLPIIENANIRVVGNEKKYQVVRAGTKYVVVERRYVISPEKSGRLTIPPTIVQGRMAITNGDSPQLRKRMNEVDMLNELFSNQGNQGNFFSPFDAFFSRRSIGPTRPYKASSQAIDVNVLPVPESFTGNAWLPAEEVKMKDSWAENPPSLKVGEPVTRTIVMQVKGLASSQIPEIYIPKPAGMKIYPELAESDTPNDGNTIYGIQRIDISYIPDKFGEVIIPEINVDWWDVNNKKQQTYTLPEWNLNVEAGAAALVEIDNAPEAMDDLNPEAEVSIEEVFIAAPSYWGWEVLIALISAIALLLFALTYQITKRVKKSPKKILKKKNQEDLINVSQLHDSLLKACKTNNKKESAELLIKYTNLRNPDSHLQNLGSLAKKLDHGSEIVKELEMSLYASNSTAWDGSKLHQLIAQGIRLKQKEQLKQNFGLAPLYPN